MVSLIKVIDLKKWFPVKRSFLSTILSGREIYAKAVDGISFDISNGEIFGLAGESGCGKTTTGRTILRLIEPTGGEVYFEGRNVFNIPKSEMRHLRRKMQMIYQDPYESINPRMSVFQIVSEPITVHKLARSQQEKEEMLVKTLENVGLTPPEQFVDTYPHELSGGQRQRVAVARCLVLNPKFIVADEPVSMLDASTRIGILSLLQELVERFAISILFISHDVAILRYISNRIGIMYLGKIVEMGPTETLIRDPIHPYTKALIAAVPVPDPKVNSLEATIGGEVPSLTNPPSGCKFHPRCSKRKPLCKKEEPKLVEVKPKCYVACHFYECS